MTDWMRKLRRASFNGQPFYVEHSSIEAGQRVSTTAIPNALWVNESFGASARKFEIEAYLTGDFCRERAEALLQAAEDDHLGTLVLPDADAVLVRLTKAKRDFKRDKLGYIGVTLEATADPPKQGGGLTAATLQSGLFNIASLIPVSIGGFLGAAFALAGEVASVVEGALDAVAGALGDLVGLAEACGLDPLAADLMTIAIDKAFEALPDFAQAPEAFGLAIGEAAITLGDVADPARLAGAILAAGLPDDPPAAYVSQGSSLRIAENAVKAVTLTACLRALALGESMARRDYADRPAALEARAIATAVLDDAIGRVDSSGIDLARDLATMQGLIGDLTRSLEGDLAPLIEVELPVPMPSLVWAWRLYGDPGRADELLRRSGAPHPAFMPQRFSVLSN